MSVRLSIKVEVFNNVFFIKGIFKHFSKNILEWTKTKQKYSHVLHKCRKRFRYSKYLFMEETISFKIIIKTLRVSKKMKECGGGGRDDVNRRIGMVSVL